MIAKVTTEQGTFVFTAESVKVGDGFLKFKNVSINNSEPEEEAWIPLTCKYILWKDKPEDIQEEKKE